VATTFDRDDYEYELRWPPQLFIDEANRLVGEDNWRIERDDSTEVGPDIEWLLTEAFLSTAPVETFRQVPWGRQRLWVLQLMQKAASWPEPGTRRPYWSARTARRSPMGFEDVTRGFIQLIREFEANGYLAQVFGQECVDERDGPALPDRSVVLHQRAGYPVADWPLEESRPGWGLDDFCDLIEVIHDLVARPTRRWYHNYMACGWHYSAFATAPARRLYRWRVNRLLADSDLGLRLAEEGEDLGRLVRVEPTGLEDLPERAVEAAAPEAVDRVQHAIALFRARAATVEERRSAVIALAGILEERRDLLKVELLTKDEAALFQIANKFAVRHQGADQRGDYDPAFLDWLFWWYLGTVELTDQLLARHSPQRPPSVRPGDIMQLSRHGDLEDDK
jgi:hypothetical protein